MKKLKSFFQKLCGLFLDSPVILPGKVTGYSLVKSQKANVTEGKSTRIEAPFYLNDISLGDYSYIANNSRITNARIGKFCSIGPSFSCGLGIHPTNGISTSPMFYSVAKQNGITLTKENKIEETKQTIVGNDVFIGANVTLLDGVNIGDGAIIGAGAVVTKDIPPYAIAVGVPAKVVKYRFEKDKIEKLLQICWWNWELSKLQSIENDFFDLEKFINNQ